MVAAFYPPAWVAEEVAGGCAQVTLLTPPGQEPHDYEPTPSDVKRLIAADLIVTEGPDLQPAVTRVIEANGIPAQRVIDLGAGQRSRPGDPHVWLDPVRMEQQVVRMRDALVERVPACKSQIEARASRLEGELAALDREYRQRLAPYRGLPFVTSHAAFGYLADRYGIVQVPIAGIDPESEPSPEAFRRVVDLVRSRGIRVVFFERMVSPRLSEAIAREAGAETRVLDPLEGLTPEEQKAGETYLTLMRKNLDGLAASFSSMTKGTKGG